MQRSLDQDTLFILALAVIALVIVFFSATWTGPRDCLTVGRGGVIEMGVDRDGMTYTIELEPDMENATVDVGINVTANDTVRVEVWSDAGPIYKGVGRNMDIKGQVDGARIIMIIVKPIDPQSSIIYVKVEYYVEASTC